MLLLATSVLTRPNDTTAYAQNDLIASSTTAGSIVVPSFGIQSHTTIKRLRLYTNKTSGMGTFQGFVELWKTAPTLTNGDNGAYAIATGAASWIGSSTLAVMTQVADGGYTTGVPTTGSEFGIIHGGSTIYWTLKEADATGFTPAANQTFTLVAECYTA